MIEALWYSQTARDIVFNGTLALVGLWIALRVLCFFLPGSCRYYSAKSLARADALDVLYNELRKTRQAALSAWRGRSQHWKEQLIDGKSHTEKDPAARL